MISLAAFLIWLLLAAGTRIDLEGGVALQLLPHSRPEDMEGKVKGLEIVKEQADVHAVNCDHQSMHSYSAQPVKEYLLPNGTSACAEMFSQLRQLTLPGIDASYIYPWIVGAWTHKKTADAWRLFDLLAGPNFQDILLKHGEDSDLIVHPVFWSGMSHRKGTFKLMEKIVGLDAGGFDVEHPNTTLGILMRRFNWFRSCHDTKEDEGFWRSVSETFASAAITMSHFLIFNGELVVQAQLSPVALTPVLLVNHEESQLVKSFLFEFELPILNNACHNQGCLIKMLDFKTRCSESVMSALRQKMDPQVCKVLCHYPGEKKVFRWLEDEWASMQDPNLRGMHYLFETCENGDEKACNADADPALSAVFGQTAELNNSFYIKHGTSHHKRAFELNFFKKHARPRFS